MSDYGLGTYMEGREVLFGQPARYVLTTLRVTRVNNLNTMSRYVTINLSQALPAGTSVSIMRMATAAPQHEKTLSDAASSNYRWEAAKDVTMNAARTQLTINIRQARDPQIFKTAGTSKAYDDFLLFSHRGSI